MKKVYMYNGHISDMYNRHRKGEYADYYNR